MNRIATMLILLLILLVLHRGQDHWCLPRQTTLFAPVRITACTILLIGGETFSRRSG
jgi:hypothetical protein